MPLFLLQLGYEIGHPDGLILEKNGKRKVLWILRDDEGNGPGSFEIQEIET